MKKKRKDKCLSIITINGRQYSIRASSHSLDRMEEYDIDEYVVSGNVLALGKHKLLQLQEDNQEAIIIDDLTDSSVVIGFKKNTINIITVIDKSNVFVKNNTRIINL